MGQSRFPAYFTRFFDIRSAQPACCRQAVQMRRKSSADAFLEKNLAKNSVVKKVKFFVLLFFKKVGGAACKDAAHVISVPFEDIVPAPGTAPHQRPAYTVFEIGVTIGNRIYRHSRIVSEGNIAGPEPRLIGQGVQGFSTVGVSKKFCRKAYRMNPAEHKITTIGIYTYLIGYSL